MLSTIALDTQVIQPGLCTGCGACQGLCPYWGSVDGRTVCFFDCERHDGRCQRFCPRMPVDLESLRKQFFPSEDILPEIGPFRGLYLTRAADESIRAHAQHGGTMTALVELAMKEGFIDAAVLTRSQGGLDPEGVLAASPEEVRSCKGSSFQVPPTLAVLNQALKEDRYKKIGVVGTPCKTLAVHKRRATITTPRTSGWSSASSAAGAWIGTASTTWPCPIATRICCAIWIFLPASSIPWSLPNTGEPCL